MNRDEKIVISNIPAISAVYFGLLQNGYNFFSFERDEEHINSIKEFQHSDFSSHFFAKTRQDTCEVYPFWPRAAMLETATFFLNSDMTSFSNPEMYHKQIMSAGNISDIERNAQFWEWVDLFPLELKKVFISDNFNKYLEWEYQWLDRQNTIHREDLKMLKGCIDFCAEHYHSPINNVKVVLSAIKCVYSSDYHIVGDCFIFSSGAFKIDSVIHEFLHHAIHPVVISNKNRILTSTRRYKDIDTSYYLAGDESGILNAFEEYLIRLLTAKVSDGTLPADLDTYLDSILELENSI